MFGFVELDENNQVRGDNADKLKKYLYKMNIG